MFTTLALGMTLAGAVAVETPKKAAADRPALVQVAANGRMLGGKGLSMNGKPRGIGHVEYEKLGKPILAERFGKRIIDMKFEQKR
jgi:hypothetical protein